MYDPDIKKEYIKYNPNNNHQFEKIMTNYFDRAEEIEKRLDKDLSQFTSAEIIAMYKEFATPSFSMLVVINNQFLNYTNWYMRNVENIDNQNHYMEMRDDILVQCLSYAAAQQNILTRQQLLDMIKDFANPYEQFLYLGLFEGIKGEQMSDYYDLRMKDFNRKKKTVTLPNDRIIPVSNELIHYAEESANEYVIYNIAGEATKRGKLLEADDRIIKCSASVGFETEKSERTLIVYRMLRKTKRYDFVPRSLSATSLMESGRIHLIKELMGDNDVETTFRNNRALIEERYGMIPSGPKWLLKYGEFCKR